MTPHPPRIVWTLVIVAGVFLCALTVTWHAPFAYWSAGLVILAAAMLHTTRPQPH